MATVTTTLGIDNFDGLTSTGNGADLLNAANGTANAGDVWNGGGGTDTLSLTSNGVDIDLSAVAISNIENLLSGKRNDMVTVSFAQYDDFAKIDLGNGKDTLTVNISGSAGVSAATLATLTSVEYLKLTGSTGDDTLKLTGSQFDRFMSATLGQGSDTLSFTSQSAKLASLSDSSLTGVDTITAADATSGMTLNLSLQSEAFTIVGSSQADTIIGGRGADRISAGGGSDVIQISVAQFANGESIDGGDGLDLITFDTLGGSFDFSKATLAAIEQVKGSGNADTLTLSSAQWSALSSLDMGFGSDIVNVLAKGDISAAAAPALVGIEQSNLLGSASAETFTALGSQIDSLVLGTGHIDFGAGTDALKLLSTSMVLNTLGSSDAAIAGLEAISAANAAAGVTLSLSGQTEAFTLTGSAWTDDLTGGSGDDVIAGGAGSDTLAGGNGNDTLDYGTSLSGVTVNFSTAAAKGGDATGDVISGFENVTGSAYNDSLTGDSGANILTGGAGSDLFLGGAGADKLNGGAGGDTASYAGSLAGVSIDLLASTASGGDAEGDTLIAIERLTGSSFDDMLGGDAMTNIFLGGDGLDQLFGRDGNDILNGGNGNDLLDGGNGKDSLTGASGDDTMSGGAGADKLIGGVGKDVMSGGADADLFVFSSTADSKKTAPDLITDFESGSDRISLAAIDADTTKTGNQAFHVITGGFTHVAGELHYDATASTLSGDVNGDAKADFVISFTAGTALLGTDIIL